MSKVYVITGGTGGMGLATAEKLVNKGTILLADVSAERLEEAKALLEKQGAEVETMVVDITNKQNVQQLVEKTKQLGALKALIHTAGLSPTLAPADKIMAVNAVGTAILLDQFIEIAEEGSVALCIASMAGHSVVSNPQFDELLKAPLAPNFMEDIMALVGDDRVLSYGLSKLATLRMVQKRVVEWGEKSARIVSISPGLITTPMGKSESNNPVIDQKMRELNPLSRYGEPKEISGVVEFLISDAASYITGTDLLVDGGVTSVLTGKTV